MKKLLLVLLLFVLPKTLFSQTIIGGPSSPDLTKLNPYPLVEMTLSNTSINDIDWTVLKPGIDINNLPTLIEVHGIKYGNFFVFTGEPGNYFVIAQALINSKNIHASINITIPTPVNPTPVNPTPVNPTPVNPTPVNTLPGGEVCVVMVADTSNATYLNSPQALLYRSETIQPLLKALNPNLSWKHYDVNSVVNNNTIPLSQTPWGIAAIKILQTNPAGAIVMVDSNGNVIAPGALPNTEIGIINYLKQVFNF